jgi:hypothetical protein
MNRDPRVRTRLFLGMGDGTVQSQAERQDHPNHAENASLTPQRRWLNTT